jgi:hypothetical protein
VKALGTRSRWAVYGVALAATLLAVRWAGGQDEPVAQPAREARDERPAAQAAANASRSAAAASREALPPLDVSMLGARAASESARDLFPALNWEQKAREEAMKRNPPRKPAPPPRPQAPPVPFTYMGKLIEDGKATVFLVQGDRNIIAREGETLADGWRVDAIAEQSMTLTYVALAQQRTLSFAAAGPAGQSARPGAPAPRAEEDNKKDD